MQSESVRVRIFPEFLRPPNCETMPIEGTRSPLRLAKDFYELATVSPWV